LRVDVPGDPAQPLLTELSGDGVATLTLNRPEKRNALSIELREMLVAALDGWRDDEAARVVVITGAPPAFCGGFDLGEFAQPELAPEIKRSSTRYHRALWAYPKPTIAAVNGAAMAGGFDLTTLCDLRIASAEASFAHPEVRLGAPPLFTPLRWLVGDGAARDLCLTGRRIDAEEALRIGLVSRVVGAGELLDEARAMAKGIAEAPERTLRAAKRYMTGNTGFGFEDSFRIEHDDVFDDFLTGGL
jgi:enoyl-CoA hydratase